MLQHIISLSLKGFQLPILCGSDFKIMYFTLRISILYIHTWKYLYTNIKMVLLMPLTILYNNLLFCIYLRWFNYLEWLLSVTSLNRYFKLFSCSITPLLCIHFRGHRSLNTKKDALYEEATSGPCPCWETLRHLPFCLFKWKTGYRTPEFSSTTIEFTIKHRIYLR